MQVALQRLVALQSCTTTITTTIICIMIFLSGCSPKITGRAIEEIPSETVKAPQIYFCPKDDCGKALESNINSANLSVHCAFYDINLRNVINSLSAKSNAIDVRVVMDSSNYKGQIKGDGIKLDNDRQLMHNKFCVIDSSIVITGSFNPTDNDNYRNNNNVVVFYSKFLAKNYEEEFDELWNEKFGNGNKIAHPIIYVNNIATARHERSENIRIENYFCPEDCQMESASSIFKGKPEDSALSKITDLIKNAKQSVKTASFTFTNEAIADELAAAGLSGINVTILTESRQRNAKGSQYQRLKDSGLDIKLDGNKYNMHHKFIVIDGKVVITGSPNFTLSGFNKNDENTVIIYDEDIALAYVREFNILYDLGN